MSVIVIVDDRVTNRHIFSKLALTIEEDVQVHDFGEPLEAIAWLELNTPDLIITDYKMPGLNGAEFVRRLREIPKAVDVPVVVITVHDERSFRLRALEAGATDFLRSPVDHHEFITRARNLLKMRRQQLLLETRATSLERELADSERLKAYALRDSRERLAQVIDTLPVHICATGVDGRLLFVNRQQADYASMDAHAVSAFSLTDLVGVETGARYSALDRLVIEQGKPLAPFEEKIADASGAPRIFLITKSPLRNAANEIDGVLTSSQDITEQKRTEAELQHLAHHDPLSGLPNRILLLKRIRGHLVRARRGHHSFALHMIDLDGFKAINDTIGHSGGDRFLKMLGSRLKEAIREHDTLARIGGDEFAILQTRVTNGDDAVEMAERVLSIVADCSNFEGTELPARASIGIAMHPLDGELPDDFLTNADFAMYRAKAEKGHAYRFYAAHQHAHARDGIALDRDLARAIEQNEFIPYFQPQIDLATGRIVGAEALLRWQRPGAGILSPAEFLGRAEKNGLIVTINEWMLLEACREAKKWTALGGEPLSVSVNMSPVQFEEHNVPLLVMRVLAESGLNPRQLDLEITESMMVKDIESVARDLRKLLDIGVGVSIDDFGSGYSSLHYASRLPVTRLKIDQSFVRNLRTDPHDPAIVRAIVTLGHSLDLTVLAEGVETQEQADWLAAEGCDQAQGYLFGRPTSAAKFRAIIAAAVRGEGSAQLESA